MKESKQGEKRQFEVVGPFDIELPPNRIFDRKECSKRFFSGEAKKCGREIGCYVFSLRTGRGSLPYYVGKTWNSFEGESFAAHKISDHYQQIVSRHQGTPTMTFVILKKARGRTPETVIKELEKHLIQMAYTRNKNLNNKQNLPKTRWSIKGVVSSGRGAPTASEDSFKQLMGY